MYTCNRTIKSLAMAVVDQALVNMIAVLGVL